VTGNEVPFNPSVPVYLNCYAVVHFAVIMELYIDLLATVTTLSQETILLRIGIIILSLTSFGFLMESRQDIEHVFLFLSFYIMNITRKSEVCLKLY
ncbi:hypothetical protein CIB84_009862, partial [Bambusicola thoracicus]